MNRGPIKRRNEGCLRRNLIVVYPAPEDIHIEAAPPLGAGQDVIIDIAGLPVGLLNLVTHNLCLIKPEQR